LSPDGQFSVVATYSDTLSNLTSPVSDSEGNIWDVEGGDVATDGMTSFTLIRVDSAGNFSRFPIEVESNAIQWSSLTLLPGPDGSMYFTSGVQSVGRVSATGHVTYTDLHVVSNPNQDLPAGFTIFNSTSPNQNTRGPLIGVQRHPLVDPNGNLWFVGTTDGLITRFTMPDDENTSGG
jgi:hypothetical protein